jgi:hypothetical protein
MTSIAISTFTMPAALAAADQLLGAPDWHGDADNPEQMAWLESFRRRASLATGMPEIRSHATESAADHVAWLLAEGWEAQIAQGGPYDLFLAATLNIVAKWKQAGRAYREGDIDRAVVKVGAYTSAQRGREHPVVEAVTQHPSFSFVFQQIATPPSNTSELVERALDIVSRNASEEVHLDFPMVNMLVRDDARYIIGLSAGPNVVTQAAEQLRLELNEIGGRASAAAEVAVTRGMGPRTIKIDGPFICAINRNGAPKDADKVAFAAYCDRDSWGRPAEGRI